MSAIVGEPHSVLSVVTSEQDIPYMVTSFPIQHSSTDNAFILSPPLEDLTDCIVSIAEYDHWKSLAIICQEDYGDYCV